MRGRAQDGNLHFISIGARIATDAGSATSSHPEEGICVCMCVCGGGGGGGEREGRGGERGGEERRETMQYLTCQIWHA